MKNLIILFFGARQSDGILLNGKNIKYNLKINDDHRKSAGVPLSPACKTL